ncbi:MAG TPA: alpha/beta fold hydrolase [Candidatus Saccharimonadales bacterium]|nr:alpha/beta fold hydrolase [Candidatus Saccharimonadales bacterium]
MTPDQHTIQETFIEVGNSHTLYVHDWGNKKATPIVYLHGGPGSQCKDGNKDLFDPTTQRVVFFDQRGCGKSLPYGSLEHNTTQALVEDIEKIAAHLKLDKFILTGGSWGSCLALAYGLKYPKRVKAMALRGIFTGSQAEINWLDQGRWSVFFPDAWDKYLDHTPKSHHDNPSHYHFGRALGNDLVAAKESAYAYDNLEGSVIKLDDRFTPDNYEEYDPAGIKIEIAYMQNRCFMPDRFILDNAHKLTMPIWLVQGRYDMVCPPVMAYELHHKLPDSHLTWVTGGHKDEHEGWNILRTILLQLTEEK